MTGKWPPTGYTNPEPYTINDRLILVIALVLTLPTVTLIRPIISDGTSAFTEFGEVTGLVELPLLYLLAVLAMSLGWLFSSGVTIILIHEGVHYLAGVVCGQDPTFVWSEYLGLKNPGIVIYETGTTRAENMLMLAGPFIILTPLCAVVMWSTSGMLSATAATMLAINTVASCADLYNVGRLVMMPRGTLFANFDDGEGGLDTEFVTPSE